MMPRGSTRNRREAEQGFALLVSMMLLVVMTLTALTTFDVVGRDRQVAGYHSRQAMSLYAAEAGLAEALRTLEETGEPDLAATNLGDGSLYSHGQPSFRLDTTVADPVEDMGTMAIEGQEASVNGNNYQLHVYRVRIEGAAPGAVTTRLEVALGVVAANTAH